MELGGTTGLVSRRMQLVEGYVQRYISMSNCDFTTPNSLNQVYF